MKTYFNNIDCIEELKKQYRKLALKHHPDTPTGNTQIMQAINNEYDELFKRYKGVFKNKDGQTYNKESTEDINTFKDIINELIKIDNIKIELIGTWLWITGDTKPIKDTLKKLNFKWSSKKLAWYYKEGKYYKKSKNKYKMDDIRNFYGSKTVREEKENNYKIAN
jgi:curved DNA-binding protein CbpA